LGGGGPKGKKNGKKKGENEKKGEFQKKGEGVNQVSRPNRKVGQSKKLLKGDKGKENRGVI